MPLYDFVESHILVYGLVLIRVLSVVMLLPPWSGRLPASFKLAGAVWLSVLFTFVVPPPELPETVTLAYLLSGALRELLAGALIGFFVRLFLGGINLGGQLAGFQMGLGIANVIDPATSEHHSVIAQWLNLLALFLFLELDGHLMVVRVAARSFEWIPPFSAHIAPKLFLDVVRHGGARMFALAFEFAWPICLVLLLTYLSMGLLARVAPQVNMLMVGFPITITVGMCVMLLGVGPVTHRMDEMFTEAFWSVERLLGAMR